MMRGNVVPKTTNRDFLVIATNLNNQLGMICLASLTLGRERVLRKHGSPVIKRIINTQTVTAGLGVLDVVSGRSSHALYRPD